MRSRPHFAGMSRSLNFRAVPIQARGHLGSGRQAFLKPPVSMAQPCGSGLTLPMLSAGRCCKRVSARHGSTACLPTSQTPSPRGIPAAPSPDPPACHPRPALRCSASSCACAASAGAGPRDPSVSSAAGPAHGTLSPPTAAEGRLCPSGGECGPRSHSRRGTRLRLRV